MKKQAEPSRTNKLLAKKKPALKVLEEKDLQYVTGGQGVKET